MSEILQVLLRHGYWVVFGASLFEQMGLPLPAMPILLAAGALSRTENFSLSFAVLAAVLGSITADVAWYALGRRRGHFMLGLVCRLSLTPDSCVQRTKDLFRRHGSPILLVAKFLPGFSATAVPLAGALRMQFARFLLFDAAGAFLWAAGYIAAGYAFSSQLERVARLGAGFGIGLTLWFALAVTVFVAWKYVQRRALLRRSPQS